MVNLKGGGDAVVAYFSRYCLDIDSNRTNEAREPICSTGSRSETGYESDCNCGPYFRKFMNFLVTGVSC